MNRLRLMGSTESIPEFPSRVGRSAENSNISIYNATSYDLEIEDDFFRSHLSLSPGETATLGWDRHGMTRVKIEVHDHHRGRLLKRVTFRSWTGWSWIVKNDIIKRQKYGDADMTVEEPNGDGLPWTEDLQSYYEQRDVQDQIDFQRILEEMREKAMTQGINVNAQPVDADDDNGEVKNLNCKVCWTKKLRILFEPCGHLVTCADCANRLSDCCVCRQKVVKKHLAFF